MFPTDGIKKGLACPFFEQWYPGLEGPDLCSDGVNDTGERNGGIIQPTIVIVGEGCDKLWFTELQIGVKDRRTSNLN